MFIGRVRIKRIGFKSAFSNPINKLANIADLKFFISNPETIFDVTNKAIAERIQTRIICNIMNFSPGTIPHFYHALLKVLYLHHFVQVQISTDLDHLLQCELRHHQL